MTPAPVVTTTTVPDANGTQRTIIVRSDENPQGTTLATNTRPTRTTSPATNPPKTTVKRPVAATRPDAIDEAVDGSRPVKPLTTGGYEELPGGGAPGAATPTPAPASTPVVTTRTAPAPTTTPAVMARTAPPVERPKTTPPVSTAPAESRPTTPALEPVATASRPAPTGPTRTLKHRVDAGQTFYSISKLYGVSIDDILTGNNLAPDAKLAVGQSLTIQNVPQGFPVGQVVTPSTAAPTTTKAAYLTHTVVKGETMYRISKQYNVSIDQIKEWNELSDVTVKEGQKLKIQQN